MHLKKLELCGFKTFPDRTLLEFTDAKGITAIVGPNGCGKSNIIDAFRWVMGEQSIKLLRGSLQEEVIFSGTEDRKPVSLAEVFLTIDNADRRLPIDYTEVEVGRRYYRTGESEYLINKEVVRLRDVQELLMDTGIGKGSYAIIGQGQVTSLLQSKPEDRRELFEEAAGINKYKTRKKVTQHKLEIAEQNLFRLKDIRAEIHQQLGPLEEQARTAKEYQVLKKDLAGLEVGLFKVKLAKIGAFQQELEQKISEYKQVVADADLSVQGLAEKKQEIRGKMLELERQLAGQDNLLQELRRQKAESANKLDVARERSGNQQQRLQAVAQEIVQLEKNKEGLLARQNEAALELAAIDQAVLELAERLAKKNEETRDIFDRWQAVRQEIDVLEKELGDFVNQLENKRSKLLGLESSEKVVAGDLQRIEQALDAYAQEQSDLAARHAELTARKTYLDQQITGLRARRDELFQQKSAKETERRDKVEQRGGIKEKFDQQSSRLALLEEMQQTHEGFQKGVRAVFQAKKDNVAGFAGVHGVAADILNVPKKYEAAVEAALENNLQAVVAADRGTVQQVIQYLKTHALGRATFTAAGLVQTTAAKINPPSGICALDVVSCDAQYQEFAAGLLGTVAIVDDLAQALALLEQLPAAGLSAAVTLAGEVVTARGLITGGAVGKENETVSLLGRQREIIELKKDIAQYTAELTLLDTEIKAIEQLFVQIEDELRDQAGELKNLEIEQGTIANDLARSVIDQDKLERNIAAGRQEVTHKKGELERIAVEKQHLLSELTELSAQKAAKEQVIQDKETALRQADSEKEKVNELLTEIKISNTNALGTKRQIQLKLDSYHDGLQQTAAQIAAKNTEKSALQTGLVETENVAQTAQAALPELEQKLTETQALTAAAMQERTRFFNDLESYDRLEKERNAADRETRSKLAEEEIKMARVEAEYQEMLRRMADEYNLTVEDVLKSDSVVEDYDRTQDEVEKLKRRIKRMEPVNLLAIEEYEAQKERLVFIETQCEDLEKSREDLLHIIKELDQTAIAAFKETFNIVNAHFQRIFVNLFKGGSASLQILDENNVLESGIEIFAKVPGIKRAQSMSLLSGGQKALTAIALLFALLSARPGPFCILDEIDAALDDMNIGKVTELLQQYAAETQIIMITHRQPMMSVAEAMFGLTMEQKGISKIVSVKLPGSREKALVEA